MRSKSLDARNNIGAPLSTLIKFLCLILVTPASCHTATPQRIVANWETYVEALATCDKPYRASNLFARLITLEHSNIVGPCERGRIPNMALAQAPADTVERLEIASGKPTFETVDQYLHVVHTIL